MKFADLRKIDERKEEPARDQQDNAKKRENWKDALAPGTDRGERRAVFHWSDAR